MLETPEDENNKLPQKKTQANNIFIFCVTFQNAD